MPPEAGELIDVRQVKDCCDLIGPAEEVVRSWETSCPGATEQSLAVKLIVVVKVALPFVSADTLAALREPAPPALPTAHDFRPGTLTGRPDQTPRQSR